MVSILHCIIVRVNKTALYIADCLSYVPEKGSVGASGDLAPLSHLTLGLMGQGQMWSPKTDWGPAKEVIQNVLLVCYNKILYIGPKSKWTDSN